MDGILGVDVSHHNGSVNWAFLASKGVKFAYLKATQGVSYTDPKFAFNRVAAKKAGIKVGAYHFLDPDVDATDQAVHFLNVIHGVLEGELPPALDVEESVPAGAWTHLSQSQRVQKVEHFLDYTDSAIGQRCVVYTSPGWWSSVIGAPDFSGHALWLAAYRALTPMPPKPWSKLAIWQYSEHEKFGGAEFDANVMSPEFAKLHGLMD